MQRVFVATSFRMEKFHHRGERQFVERARSIHEDRKERGKSYNPTLAE